MSSKDGWGNRSWRSSFELENVLHPDVECPCDAEGQGQGRHQRIGGQRLQPPGGDVEDGDDRVGGITVVVLIDAVVARLVDEVDGGGVGEGVGVVGDRPRDRVPDRPEDREAR